MAGEAIAKGECGFAYVLWEDSLKIPNEGPLLITPMIPGKREFDYEFSKEHYSGNVVILRVDGWVETLRINSDGHLKEGDKDYFDWSQPHWGGQKPRIVWPE